MGTGSPAWGDPRNVCTRMFSNHIVWLCHKKPMSASEIAEEPNVPTVYVEEELEILRKGENGEYGFLRRLESGKYAIYFFEKSIEISYGISLTDTACSFRCKVVPSHLVQMRTTTVS